MSKQTVTSCARPPRTGPTVGGLLPCGWLMQVMRSTESYKDTSKYRESEEYRSQIDARLKAYGKMLRAIDLE